jgi:hypothetical protein
LRKGIRASTEALLAGYAVFSPFIDFQFFLSCQGEERITPTMIKNSSMEWLKAADAVLLLPDWEDSAGTWAELEMAMKDHIPIFTSLEQLKNERRFHV